MNSYFVSADILVNTSIQITSDMCIEVEVLPTDLYTEEGGSIPYGGPQVYY